jgi:UDP-N-acetylmuramate dehydrogenase
VTNRIFDILKGALRGQVLADEPLAPHTTWRIGGPADLFLRPLDSADLVLALSLLQAHRVPWEIVGGGSNLLVRDGGVRGAVLHLGHLDEVRFGDHGLVRAGSGVPLMALIRQTAERGLGGLEGLAGIPGTLGGAVAMNAGAGGRDMASVVRSVLLAGAEGSQEWPAAQLSFGYRRSELPPGRVITEVLLQLQPAEPAELLEEIAARLQHRHRAQGVGGPNAGSVFKNPPRESAWRLIDRAGLRGATVGQAQVSERHCNFIVNRGGATAGEVLALIGRVRDEVEGQTGIRLETEVRIIGQPKAN